MANWQYCGVHKKVFYDDQCDLCMKVLLSNPGRIKRSYVKKDHRSIFERFHNYGVKFDAQILWDAIFVDPTFLNNNVQYKRLDFPEAIVKVFKRSILVTLRSSQEIKGLKVRDAEQRSFELVDLVVKKLPKSIIVQDRDLVNVHNAFVNHPTARHKVFVKVDGDARLISDNSKGYPEFEAVNPQFAVSDSEILEKFNEDLIVNNPVPLSNVVSKLNDLINDHNTVTNILGRYAHQMELHLTVEQKTSDNLDRIGQALDKIVAIGSQSKDLKKPRRSFNVTSPRCHR
jgi:hypothetical protein